MPTHLARPEVWFDGWLRELEELAYNVPFLLAAWCAARRFKPDLIYQRHTAFNVAGALLSQTNPTARTSGIAGQQRQERPETGGAVGRWMVS